MRGLLRAWHEWASAGTAPPASQYPRLSDTIAGHLQDLRFPVLPGAADPRRIVGPARRINGTLTPLPFLVPQVDRDGNEVRWRPRSRGGGAAGDDDRMELPS